MIQDIDPHRIDNQYHPDLTPSPGDGLMAFRDRQVLCRIEGDALRLPVVGDLPGAEDLIYLFSIDQKKYYGLPDQACQGEAAGFAFREVWRKRGKIRADQTDMFAIATASHLLHWYRTNRYCGCCGQPTVHSRTERALQCPACGNTIYPRVVPAVIIAVTNGDQILVTKYGDRDLPFYALVAGFVEIGESLEECVAREVMEEVGLRVKNIRYYKSQPWGIVDDILAGFFCQVDGDPTIHLDHKELKEGIWAKRGQVPLQPDHYSLTGEMMRRFNEGYQPYS